MEDFNEYLQQGEPNRAEKARDWKTAIGLQQVDGLKPSDYLVVTAKQNIEGDITIEEVKQRIDNYYEQSSIKGKNLHTEEADKVSVRIAEILNEQTFVFSIVEYISIHRRLFNDLYNFAGKIRDYNITKKEWVLDGESVLYASADILKETLEYDFEQERKFNFNGLNEQKIIEHIAYFTSNLWQIHPFGEGNTRTTAVFLIKYLRKLGYKNVNNEMFENHSWYFRNALVRANYENISKGIHKTEKFLIYFFQNLLKSDNHVLSNRELHIHNIETVKTKNDTVNDTVFNLIKQNNNITANEISNRLKISLSTAKRRIKTLKESGKIKRKGSDKTGSWQITE